MKLHIRCSDLEQAKRFKATNPILFAVQNVTKTLWRMLDGGVLVEAIPPYRRCQLPAKALTWHQEYLRTGQIGSFDIEPLEIELEVADSTNDTSAETAPAASASNHQPRKHTKPTFLKTA
jgi:hypothetical protein